MASKVFRKAVLACDTYQSGDGSVTVTPSRLINWERQFRRLSQAGYAVPMHWNHAELDDPEMLHPITMDALSKRDTRGAHNTEGRLVDFIIAPDGNSAEFTVEILTPTAQEKVEANAVYVSPVIFPEFTDGHGQTYSDVITSVDLVDYPVDHSQGPFIPAEPAPMRCAIRMGIKPAYFQRIIRMDMQQPPAMQQQPDMPTDGMGGGDVVSQIVQALTAAGIPMPPDTDESNIVERIGQVLGGGAQGGTTAVSPEIQTMSLSVKQHRQYAEAAYHRELTQSLTALRDSGRVSDAEYSLHLARATTQRLSLDRQSKPVFGEVEKFIQSREVLPEGVFKTSTFNQQSSVLARMSASPAKPPAPRSFSGAKPMDSERVKELVSLVNGS